MTISTKLAIIQITTSGKNFSQINYSRRMYAIIRRYTPNVVEGITNECFADLTGLRTFFKMSYKEIVEEILKDLQKEIGIFFTAKISTVDAFDSAKNKGRRSKSISTYKELNRLFVGGRFTSTNNPRTRSIKRKKLIVPFLGKVA